MAPTINLGATSESVPAKSLRIGISVVAEAFCQMTMPTTILIREAATTIQLTRVVALLQSTSLARDTRVWRHREIVVSNPQTIIHDFRTC